MQPGVDFPAASNGTRSTTATGRAVIADALRAVDPGAARRVEAIKDWRSGYLSAIRDLVVVAAANTNARLYHLRGVARPVAHLALNLGGRVAPSAVLGRFDWLYRYDVTKGA